MIAINPYEIILKKLSKKRISFIVIGVSGINYYSNDPGNIFSTQDCDVLVKPIAANILSVLKILEKEKYQLETNREPLVGLDSWLAEKIIEHQAVVTAKKGKVLRIDIVIDGGGFSFQEWNKDKRIFLVEGIKVPVGSLMRLIRAKENSNREKDRKFLALYKIQIKEMLKNEKE